MATTSDLSRNAFIRYNNELVQVLDYDHITPGKGNAIYSCKCRNVETGKQSEIRFRSGEKIDLIRVDEYEMQYLFTEGDFLVCMNQETYDQLHIPKILFADSIQFLQEGMILKIRFDENDKPLSGLLPQYVELSEVLLTLSSPALILKSLRLSNPVPPFFTPTIPLIFTASTLSA